MPNSCKLSSGTGVVSALPVTPPPEPTATSARSTRGPARPPLVDRGVASATVHVVKATTATVATKHVASMESVRSAGLAVVVLGCHPPRGRRDRCASMKPDSPLRPRCLRQAWVTRCPRGNRPSFLRVGVWLRSLRWCNKSYGRASAASSRVCPAKPPFNQRKNRSKSRHGQHRLYENQREISAYTSSCMALNGTHVVP